MLFPTNSNTKWRKVVLPLITVPKKWLYISKRIVQTEANETSSVLVQSRAAIDNYFSSLPLFSPYFYYEFPMKHLQKKHVTKTHEYICTAAGNSLTPKLWSNRSSSQWHCYNHDRVICSWCHNSLHLSFTYAKQAEKYSNGETNVHQSCKNRKAQILRLLNYENTKNHKSCAKLEIQKSYKTTETQKLTKRRFE